MTALRRTLEWLATLASVVLLVFCVARLLGCASTRDAFVEATNAAAFVGDAAETTLAGGYDRTQRECLEQEPPAAALQCVVAVRARYRPAWAAYDAFRASWVALAAALRLCDAAVALGQAPDIAGVVAALEQVTATQRALEQAMSALGRAGSGP